MSAVRIPTSQSEASGTFSERCRSLGIPLWRCDGAGAVMPGTGSGGEGACWTMAATLSGEVAERARQWCGQERPEPVDVRPGWRLLPLVEKAGSRRLGMVIALLPDEGGEAAQRMETMLRWCHADLTRGDRDVHTLDQFSERLAHAYEEINLLYGLGRAMNQVAEPRTFLKQTLTQLHDNLPFAWVATRFDGAGGVVPVLEGHLELLGSFPGDADSLSAQAGQVIEALKAANTLTLMAPGVPGLASLSGAEVVAVPIRHDGEVIGALLAGNKGGDDPDVSSVETKFLEAAADFLGVYHENAARFHEQRTLFFGTLRALTASIDAKDRYTCGHSERVGFLAEQVALLAGFDADQAEQYRICGLVHDVGKIGISEAVLRKPGKLTDEEFKQIKRHPRIGYEILKDIPPIRPILPGVLYHHERWDGKGYPEGLRGEEIPTIAAVVAVADIFDAMSSSRSYRSAMPRAKVFAEIDGCLGEFRDPPVAELIRRCDLAAYDRMLATHQDRVLFAA